MGFFKDDDWAVLRAFLVFYGLLAAAWIITAVYTARQ
jgi:hypothetical protein